MANEIRPHTLCCRTAPALAVPRLSNEVFQTAFPGDQYGPLRRSRCRKTRWRSGTIIPRRSSTAKRWRSTCASRSRTGTRSAGRAPIRSAPARSIVRGRRARTRSPSPSCAWTRHSSFSRRSARRSGAGTTATSPRKARRWPSPTSTSTRSSRMRRACKSPPA